MLMRSDPFSGFDWLTQRRWSSSSIMPMDAYRQGDEYVVHVDLPGVDPAAIDVRVEHGTVSVMAQRSWDPGDDVRLVTAERPQGSFTRQVFLGQDLDAERVHADYNNGVLTVRAPIREHATTRKVQITSGDGNRSLQESNN